jgi:intein/homing endonuclease
MAPQTIENKLEFGLSNGSIVKAAASTEKSARSPSLSLLVFDECAHIENFDDIWTAASATLSCVDYNTIITTDSGLYRIGDLKSDDMKYGFNDHQINIINKDGEVELSDSYYISEPSDVIEVFFKSGTSITITKNHPLMTNGGWVIGENLKIGDLVHKRFNTQSFGKLIEYPKFKLYPNKSKTLNNDISKLDLAYFYGLYIAEGNRGGRKKSKNPRISITNTDNEIINFLITKFGFRLVDDRHLLLNCHELSEYMKYVGIDYSTAKFKKIPNKILSASQEEQVSFLQGLFDGDGSAHTIGGTITYTSASKQLIYDVYTMLLNFGIKSNIKYTESSSPKSTVVKNKDLKYICYKLSIYGKNARKYFNDIGFRLTRKQELQNNFKNGDYITVDKNVVKALILKSGFTLTNFKLNVVNVSRLLYSGAVSITEDSLEKILENTNKNTDEWNILNNILEKHNNTFEYFDEIIKIENAGYKETYDLKVPKSHSFLANNIISHNTGGDSILLSSPNGMGGKFHSIWVKAEEGTSEEGLDPFNAIRLDWRVHPERDDAWAARERDKLGAREFSQEHEVNFLTSGHTVVEPEILEWIRDKMVCEPIEKRYSGDLWIWDYPNYTTTYAVCLPKGEVVITENGIKKVEDVCHHNNLYDKDGISTKITEIKELNYVGDIFDLKISNSYRTTKFTPEHPIYCSTSKLLRNYNKNNKTYRFNERYWEHDFKFKDVKDVAVGDWVKFPNMYKFNTISEDDLIKIFNDNKTDTRIDFKISDSIILDEEFWWYVGIWLAEGWVYKTKRLTDEIYTAHNINEVDIINRIKNLFLKYGRRISVTENIDSNVTTVKFSSKEISSFLYNLFGKYVLNKHISENIKFIPDKFKYKLISGYCDGDGCIIKNGRGRLGYSIRFVSISLKLLEDVQDILFSLGIISTASKLRNPSSEKIIKNNKKVNTKTTYQLSLSAYDTNKFVKDAKYREDYYVKLKNNRIISNCYLEKDNSYIYFKVKSNKKYNFNGVIYNFSTESGTFLCKNIATHNCGDVARGDGGDYSAFSVFDVETSKQVASYKAKIGTREYARLLVAVATEYNNALLVVDNRNAGWDTVQEIINIGYENLFYTYRNDPYFDPNIQLKKRYDLVDNKDKTPGLSTTERVRQVMMSKLEMNVNAKEVLIRDLRTLNELNVFLWVHGKPQAQNGSNDDLVSALAMYLFVRDTAIRMHEMGIQLSKKALQNTHKSVYKPQRFNDPYNLKIGNNENFDLRDLLPKK